MGVVIDASSPAIAVGDPSATTASFTPPNDCRLLVAFSGNSQSNVDPATPTITDSLGAHLTYTLGDFSHYADFGPGIPGGQTAMWTAPVVVGAAMTISVTNNAATDHNCAVKVWVLTGADVGTHGKGLSTSATAITQNFTGTVDGSQGFLVAADWTAQGTQTAGSGCTMDGSATPGGFFSYGFAHRTVADGSDGGLTGMNVNLPGSSNGLFWSYFEIVPLVGDPAEKDPPPYINWRPPGEGLAPNGAWSPWLGTANAAPPDTGLRIHESSPFIAVNTVNSTTTVATTSFTPPAGSLLLVLWAGNSATGANPTAPAITDSLGGHLTYTQSDWQSRADAPTVNGQAAIWTAPVASAAPMTVTVTNNAATGFRESAVQVLVLINEHPSTPVGAHGKAGSASLQAIAQSYTAQGTGGQGFLVYSDWSERGIAKAGTDCWPAREGSFGTLATIFSWGMFRRLIPDDVNAVSNRINVNLPSASTSLAYTYIEILPASGATAENGVAVLALRAAGTATKVAACSGTTALAVAASGSARKTSLAAGTSVLALSSSGVETVAGARQQSGSCVVALGASGSARKGVSRSGTAVVALAATGSARKTAAPAGTTVVALRSSGAGSKLVSRTGLAELALRATGTVVKTSPSAGAAVVALRATGTGSKTVSLTGTAPLALIASASSAVARLQTGTCGLALSTSSAARKVAPATGTARTALVTTGTEVKRATPTGSAVLATRSVGTARKTSLPAGRAAVALRATGTVTALRTQTARCVAALGSQAAATARRTTTGRGLLALQAHSFVGAPPPAPPVGMDQGSATAPLLSGTATPGPTLGGDTGTGITSDMALTVASTLG